jgi:hypothetical protein
MAKAVEPLWISEPIGFCHTDEIDLKHFCPVPPAEDTIGVIADHAMEISDRCGCPMLLETIASPLRFCGPMPGPEFLNRLCARSGCRLLLDVTGLFVDSRNHLFEATDWLSQLDPAAIAQLHVSGYRQRSGRWEDCHDAVVQNEIWELARLVLDGSPGAGGILEHDTDIPAIDVLEQELCTLRDMVAGGPEKRA